MRHPGHPSRQIGMVPIVPVDCRIGLPAPPPELPGDLPPLMKSDRPAKSTKTQWHQFVTAMTNPDLIAMIALCAIALLTMINVILRFPNLGALIERYNHF
jgi:hypothetical protein